MLHLAVQKMGGIYASRFCRVQNFICNNGEIAYILERLMYPLRKNSILQYFIEIITAFADADYKYYVEIYASK